MIREAFQDLNRVRQIAVIAARHGFADVLERSGLWARLGRKEVVEQTPESRRESVARRFRTMLGELGPTFVKLGQVLSTRADLLPAEFIEELSSLQDQVPPIPFEAVAEQIKEAFQRPLEELFPTFDPVPLAAASIAQVHRAVTVDGDEVVVKVQRPKIAERIRADLSVLHSIARALEAMVEEVGVYTPTGIIEEFDRAIHEELDFLNEAANIRAFYKNHIGRSTTRIPKVYDSLSTRSVLTMEYLRGTKLSQAMTTLSEAGKQRLAQNMVENGFQQLFEDGLFHGDPHPGNLLVLDGQPENAPVVGLIDFGLVGRITKQMADTLISLIVAVAIKDADSVARLLYRQGSSDRQANLLGFKNDIEAIIGKYLPAELSQINAKSLMRDLLDLAVKYRIRVPKEYAILSRASIATEGILRSLYPTMNIGKAALPYAKHLLTDRFDPNQLQGGLMKTMLRLQTAANELPMQLSQILIDLESGKFSITVRAEQMGELIRSLRSMAMISFFGLCACGLIVGAFISFSGKHWMVAGVPLLGLFAAISASFLTGGMLTWYLFGRSVKKVSLSRLLRKGR